MPDTNEMKIHELLTRIERPYKLTGLDNDLSMDDYLLTETSKAVYQAADPGQGFVCVVNLQKNADKKHEVHLLASSNQGDGLPVARDARGRPFLQSKAALGKGGHNIHMQAVFALGLAEQYEKGLLLGCGIWKNGWGIKFPDSIPDANGRIPNEYLVLIQDGQPKVYYVNLELAVHELPAEPLTETMYYFFNQLYDSYGKDLKRVELVKALTTLIRAYHQAALAGEDENSLENFRSLHRQYGYHHDRDAESGKVLQFMELYTRGLSSTSSSSEAERLSAPVITADQSLGMKHMRISSTSLNDGSIPKTGGSLGGCKYNEIYLAVSGALIQHTTTHLNEISRELPLPVFESLAKYLTIQFSGIEPDKYHLNLLLPAQVRFHKEVETTFCNKNPVINLYQYSLIRGHYLLATELESNYPDILGNIDEIKQSLFIGSVQQELPDTSNPDTSAQARQIIRSNIDLMNNIIEMSQNQQDLFALIMNELAICEHKAKRNPHMGSLMASLEKKLEAFLSPVGKLLSKGINLNEYYHIHNIYRLSLTQAIFLLNADADPQTILNLMLRHIEFNPFDDDYTRFGLVFNRLIASGAKPDDALLYCNLKKEWLIDYLIQRGAKTDVVSLPVIAAEYGHTNLLNQYPGTDADRAEQFALAAMNDHGDIIRILHEQMGADPDCTKPDGKSPLMIAVEYGKREALQALLAAGADANKPDKEGHLLAVTAAKHGLVDIIAILIRNNVDCLKSDSTGMTAVTAAALFQKGDCLHHMRIQGIDLLQPDANGKTLKSIAEEKFSPDLNHVLMLVMVSEQMQAPQSPNRHSFFYTDPIENKIDEDMSIKDYYYKNF